MCDVQGFLIQFCYLSSVFWLSSMSRLMWKTFSKIRGFNAFQKHYKYGFQDPKYKFYALYSWGCPFIITSITVLMQYLPDELIGDGLTKPRIGKNNCFIDNKGNGILDLPQLWYFHIFNAPILVSLFEYGHGIYILILSFF